MEWRRPSARYDTGEIRSGRKGVSCCRGTASLLYTGTAVTSNPVAAAIQSQADGERLESETAGTSNPVATGSSAQADGDIIEMTMIFNPRTFNPAAVVTPAQSSGEILDTETSVTSNPVPAQVVMPISMARPSFRAVNQDLFTPLSVPIGPYHVGYCSERWKQEKQRVAEETLRCLRDSRGPEAAHQLEWKVRNLVDGVSGCYGGFPAMDSQKLFSMLRNDGCYVLRFLVKYPGFPHVQLPSGEGNTVMCDIMYLLENQLPVTVLQRIHECLITGSNVAVDVREAVQGFLLCLLRKHMYVITTTGTPPREQAATCDHLLQLVQVYLQPKSETSSVCVDADEQPEEKGLRVGRWRRATEYSRYGNVQLKPRTLEDGAESILDVCLVGNTLWIPCLRIDGSTWTMLRNLMALEEQTGTRPVVTAYCMFMSQLASKVEDIELLMRKKIVDHSWGNEEEVARGFADLCKKVVLDVNNGHSNYLRDTWRELHKRCESRGHNCWGSFLDMHCGDTMRILAFVTAGLLFAFQLIQVILAGISLRQHGK
ncbi:hypothetical protein D1007_36570 [Hordeum vulgare]|nr:hypothetical protein D1007_36570 [Hordeum vulgare]